MLGVTTKQQEAPHAKRHIISNRETTFTARHAHSRSHTKRHIISNHKALTNRTRDTVCTQI